MKIIIGKYIRWFGPYQFMDLFRFVGMSKERRRTLAEKLPVEPFNRIHSFRKRKIKVKIDCWDSWSLFSDLAQVIAPLLRDFRQRSTGSPLALDLDDVPSSLARPQNGMYAEAWDWILGEMIWAFENVDVDEPLSVPEETRRNRGLIMFGKYYRHLWN